MKKLSASQIRQLFIQFFKEKDHQEERSASLVPKDDPSLLWINSGVATLKKYFDGSIVPDNPRIVNAQKSIRTNDIENVGFTARHHTFFEMLGNFSIGDYFKEKAIIWAWEFLTDEKWIGFDKDLLYVTVHPEDDEAYDIWLNTINLEEERIIRLEENYWDIGEGPSGPNTEIFYDRGEDYGNDPTDPELYPGGENDRYLEVWNLVFSQFNHNPDGTYTPLPKKNIDTGMGLERMASILQNVKTNYDTDLFMPIINKTSEFSTIGYGKDKAADAAYKIIADHIRTVSFAVGDHALPSNEGRGYILRRLIRRAARYAKNLGIEKPFMYKLVPVVGSIMEDYYPEVAEQQQSIMNIIKVEEQRFYETLNEGIQILTEIVEKQKQHKDNVIPGEAVFKLYDTYGFPKELTEEFVYEHGFTIDESGFEREMEKQRNRARTARAKSSSMQVQDDLLTDLEEESTFIGYEQLQVTTKTVKIIGGSGYIDQASEGDEVWIILKETPFYAESGGQVADKGIIFTDQASATVIDVQKAPHGQHIHQIKVDSGTITMDQVITAEVNDNSRSDTIKNHTATHILHQALRDVLGSHIHQAGSLVAPERLRFDFTHYEAVRHEQLIEIERIVNKKIWSEIPLTIQHMKLDEAKEIGAMALFGEKYSDVVRVVQIGDYSIELCGGCHVKNSSEIGLFKIISEGGIGAGVRRIEAVTSKHAFKWMEQKIILLGEAALLLNTSEERILEKIKSNEDMIKTLKRESESLSAKIANQELDQLVQQVKQIHGVNILAEKVSVKDMNQLRNMVDDLKQKLSSGVILLAMENKGKVQFISGVTKDLIERNINAGKLINQVAKVCDGGGGGRPDMAQAGAKDPTKIDLALDMVSNYVEENLK